MCCRRILTEGQWDAPSSHGLCDPCGLRMRQNPSCAGDRPLRVRWAARPDPRVVTVWLGRTPVLGLVRPWPGGSLVCFIPSVVWN
jgi:hypothetical protein